MKTKHVLPVVLSLALGCGGSTESPAPNGSGGTGGVEAGVGGSSGTGGVGGHGGTSGVGGMGGGLGGAAGVAGAGGQAGMGGGTGGSASWTSCQGPGWCSKQYNGCCEPCVQQTLDQFTGVNVSPEQITAFRTSQCPNPNPGCPDCEPQINPNFASFCLDQQCKMIDVRLEAVSQCTQDSDCMMRYPDCCELCGAPVPELLIALNKSQTGYYQQQVCSALAGACPPCAPSYPTDYVAYCGASGHCEIAQLQGDNACPEAAPTNPQCKVQGLSCEWGVDPRLKCRENGTCEGGTWQYKPVPNCPPLPGPGVNGCPTTMDVNGDSCKGLEGAICDMSPLGEGFLCVCDQCVGGGPCTQYGRWGCFEPASGCPPTAPGYGHKCSTIGQTCVYGICGTATSAARNCGSAGLWVDEPVACPL